MLSCPISVLPVVSTFMCEAIEVAAAAAEEAATAAPATAAPGGSDFEQAEANLEVAAGAADAAPTDVEAS